jgi:hypothetical protein
VLLLRDFPKSLFVASVVGRIQGSKWKDGQSAASIFLLSAWPSERCIAGFAASFRLNPELISAMCDSA